MPEQSQETPNQSTLPTAIVKIAQIHADARAKIREDLNHSLEKHVDEGRDKTIDQVTGKMADTFERQLNLFVHVERELVLNLNGALSARYQGVLNRLQNQNTQLSHLMGLVTLRVVLEAERVTRGEGREKTIDIFLGGLAMLVIR